MKLIKPGYEILPQPSGLDGIYKQIEIAGRTCYKSESNGDDPKKFVDRMAKSFHDAMLEHGTVYLIMPNNCMKYIENNYSKVFHGDGGYYITTNLRVLHENDWLSDLQYLCEPTQYHEKRHTVRFVTDRATANQFVRHRAFSFAQESQRYVNYSKGRFDSEIKFVLPCWMDNRLLGNYDYWNNAKFDDLGLLELTFVRSMIRYEVSYMSLLDKGWKPEQARLSWR